MKWLKNILYLVSVIVLLGVLIYGFIVYSRNSVKKDLTRANVCYENGEIEKAIGFLEDIYYSNPSSPVATDAVYLLAKSYTNLNQLERAEKYWNILMKSDNQQFKAECLYNLADIAEKKGETDKAVRDYRKIIDKYYLSSLVDDAKLNLAMIMKEKGQLKDAKNELESIVENYPSSNLISTAESELGNINIELLFSAVITDGSTEYIVKEGDMLYTIAQEYGTTVDLIKKSNNLKSDFIKPGNRLKIITDKFSIVVDKSRNILILKSGEKVVKVYSVGTGLKGSTPAGSFIITNKLVNPPWHKPGEGVIPFGDERNVLGTRWMGLNVSGYGLHGTWEPESIGQQESAGCIRLHNKDVEELYEIVPSGIEVAIME